MSAGEAVPLAPGVPAAEASADGTAERTSTERVVAVAPLGAPASSPDANRVAVESAMT